MITSVSDNPLKKEGQYPTVGPTVRKVNNNLRQQSCARSDCEMSAVSRPRCA